MVVTGSTFSGNAASGSGGAIAAGDGTTTSLRSTTISRNIGSGGGLAVLGTGTATMRNTILAGNSDGMNDAFFSEWFCEGNDGIASEGYNLLPTAIFGCSVAPAVGDQSVADPGLGPLAFNGGPTPTHALVAGSPALARGNPATPGTGVACPASDQRGVPRSLGGRCDVGAYERVLCQGRLVNVVGTTGADELAGTTAADGILGLGGNDVLSGGGGGDGLCAGDGNDQLRGEAGNDSLDGGAGTDTCDGGTQTDQAVRCETLVSVP
jgi:predicted outer membrane repeat protein